MSEKDEPAAAPVTIRSLRSELASEWFGLDRGLAHTALNVWRDPAGVARRYVVAHEPTPVSPLRYLLLAIAGYTGLAWLFLNPLGLAARLSMTQAQSAQVDFVMQHAGWIVLLVVPIAALVLWLPRAGRETGYVEALALVAYTQAQVLWVQALAGLPLAFVKSAIPSLVLSLAIAAYLARAWRALHGDRAVRGWLAAVLALIVGTIANQVLVYLALRIQAMS